MFSLKDYFKNTINNNALDGSWVILGWDEEEKMNMVLEFVLETSNSQGVFIISNPGYLNPEISDKVQNFDVGIGSVRQAIRFLSLTNSYKKFLIINRAEDLEFEAQNALLKVVEEPPLNSVIIFLTKNESGILSTLKSRAKIVNVPILNHKKYFQSLLSPDAINFLDSGGSDFSLVKKNFGKKGGEDLRFLESLVILLRDQMLDSQNLKELKLSSVSGKFDLENLKLAVKILRRVKNYNVNPRLQTESLMCKLF